MSIDITVTKKDGTQEKFNADRINKSIQRACEGLPDAVGMVTQIATETELTLYNGVTEKELDEATINAALQNVKDDPAYDIAAKRLLAKTVYRAVLGDFDKEDGDSANKLHRQNFPAHIKDFIERELLDTRMGEKFDLDKLAVSIDCSRDEFFNYAGLSGLLNRYSLKNIDQTPAEVPQYTFMRIAMGLSFNEEDPTAQAIEFYEKMSRLDYIAGGSTNVNAGTRTPALSNCFLIQMEDTMDHIAKSVADVMLISKATGGIGMSVSKLRATGSPLKSSNTISSGPTSFAKIFDVAISAIVRGGKKKGALAFYMETWHLDFPEFIEWRHNAGDDLEKMRQANTAAWISDEFMKRVVEGADWYLFDPAETEDLVELYGSAFSKRYAEYIEKAEVGEIRNFKKVTARELYRKMLAALQGTSHPWLTWKDTINLRAINNNTGTIHMSNLCTEICLPQDRDNIAVCNLASINIVNHLNSQTKEVDWQALEDTVRLGVRHLDNLVDINDIPVEEARNSDMSNRAVGLGVMGIADAIEKMGWSYDSNNAYDFVDKVFEFVSYMAIDESAELAEVRGSYPNFEGSGWSKGMVPIDTLQVLEDDRGVPLTVDKESKHGGLDWDVLRVKVKNGMRNATLMADGPNANIGVVGNTTPGMDPRFAQVFSRNKISGKYLDINGNLVKDLKDLGIWEQVREDIIANHGDIESIEVIPPHIREIYKTSFGTSPYAFIEVAARAQKWIDQAISRNMYLATRNNDEIMDIYTTAWQKGLKSTYYLHMKPRHTAEQSTLKVNKSASIGKKGFGGVKKTGFGAAKTTSVPTTDVTKDTPSAKKSNRDTQLVSGTCPVDPALRAQCDSCQ